MNFEILKENKKNPRNMYSRIFTASARAAMTHILRFKKIKSAKGILLPAYIGLSHEEGSGVFDPVHETKFSYQFYKMDSTLHPDLIDLEKHLASGNFQLVFLIHYFGFSQVEIKDFMSLCHSYGVQVIEDYAHSLPLNIIPENEIEHSRDFSIYSIHKNTTSLSGGFYIDHTGELKNYKPDLDLRIDQDALEIFANTDISMNTINQIENYNVVASWVHQIEGISLLFNETTDCFTPLNCPIIVHHNKREELYNILIKNNIWPTALYHRLIPQITREEFPTSHMIADNILNLPIHPGVTSNEYKAYKKILQSACIKIFST
jgi:dTDP-4-amino-4,6-dideoxygalactose transaminase